MVSAKRARNRAVLERSGLLEASRQYADMTEDMIASEVMSGAATKTHVRGIRAIRKRGRGDPPSGPRWGGGAAAKAPRRKSSRIAGVKSDGFYVDAETQGKFVVRGNDGGAVETPSASPDVVEHFNDRINDGSDLSIGKAVELLGAKWIREGSAEEAEQFVGGALRSVSSSLCTSAAASLSSSSPSPCSVVELSGTSRAPSAVSGTQGSGNDGLEKRLASLRINDGCVAKVVPERIYSVACHPSADTLVVCAGDKLGHVGIWNVDGYCEGGGGNGPTEDVKANEGMKSGGADGVYLFRPHSGPVTHLEWDRDGGRLLSASYDGSVRLLDIETQTFREVFATYDDSDMFRERLGYGLDTGHRYWVQHVCSDHRAAGSGDCLFLATSVGTVAHLDMRVGKGKITFHKSLSEKKINSVSLHPNGHVLATAGLDNTVKLWDVRAMGSKSGESHLSPGSAIPLAFQDAGRSVNSAFFSPSGSKLLSTTMADSLDITENIHIAKGRVAPTQRVKHNNRTGRWISTFMARWHPGLDDPVKEMFVVGSMGQPRTVEVYGGKKIRMMSSIGGRRHDCRGEQVLLSSLAGQVGGGGG